MDAERARRIETTVVGALQARGARPVADEIGVSESTVSRLKNEHLADFSRLLSACELKVVPVTARCYQPESIEAIFRLAKERMEQLKSSRELEWEE